MTVNVRAYRGQRGVWEVDIRVQATDSTIIRERRKAPAGSKRAAMKWGIDRERELLTGMRPGLPPPAARRTQTRPERKTKPRKQQCEEVLRLKEFIPRYLSEYCQANRQKPSTIDAKESLIRLYLVPQLGERRLDAITPSDLQALKGVLHDKSAKTVNNVLSVLNTIMRCAKEWGVITEMPVRAAWLKTSWGPVVFFDFEEFERLVDAAYGIDPRTHATVLLGGEAGLRRGEMLALRWSDLDLRRGIITVARSTWNGHTTQTKGGRIRTVPMTARLRRTLLAFSKVTTGEPTVLFASRGGPATAKNITTWMWRAQEAAGLDTRKGAHTLRHTFCSHLAMRGAAPRAIQELAGHRHITTTERYMHLSPAALEGAIRLLELNADP